MAEIKLSDPFGLNHEILESIDFDTSLSRILNDVKTDFIYAPHINLIYARAQSELKNLVKSELASGKYMPGLPFSMEVPKTYRIPVETSKRLGPAYSRPGSILHPKDRLFYQAIADQAAPIIGQSLNPDRSFSHQLASSDSKSMFQSTRKCWNDLQKAITENSKDPKISYVLKADIANYFGSINLHTLINVLDDYSFPKALNSRLEALLLKFTGERSSRSIIQGIYPSDLFGNFYMAPIDRILDDAGVKSARYVDDLYIFVESVDHADRILRELIPALRGYDLSLNESKCKIVPKSLIHTMEPDLEVLFNAAVDEISEQLDDGDFDSEYGFQSEWEGEDDEDESSEAACEEDIDGAITLAATIRLFQSTSEYPGHEENIERFCLPLFAKAESNYAVPHVKEAFKKRASMSQIYAAYLAKFLDEPGVRESIVEWISDEGLMDWQRMWLVAALMQSSQCEDSIVKDVFKIVKDGNKHDALRGAAAYFVGRFGDHARRQSLRQLYPSVSEYVQAAIYASSRFWPGVEASNAKSMWAGQGQLHTLLTEAMKKK